MFTQLIHSTVWRIRRILRGKDPASRFSPFLFGGFATFLLAGLALALEVPELGGPGESEPQAGQKVQARPASVQEGADPRISFGPVIVKTLSLGTRESKPFLRLESGRLVEKPDELEGSDDARVFRWMKRNDVQIGLMETRGGLHLLCFDLPAVYQMEPQAAERFNQMSAEDFLAVYASAGFGVLPFESTLMVALDAERRPTTIYFPTRGLLQITEVKLGQPVVVKVSYKLVVDKRTPGENELGDGGGVRIDQLLEAAGIKLDKGRVHPAKLPDLFEERPPGSHSYELRTEVVAIPSRPSGAAKIDSPQGAVYYLPRLDLYYVQRNPIGSSQLTYYGPFPGDPRRIASQSGIENP